jgi:hypothetical protein
MKNNLFYYATTELSQDAFLCWLLSFAMKDSIKDEDINNCAKSFIREIIPELSCGNSCCEEDIFITQIERQYRNIDILFTVNDKYVVIIENKIHSDDHSNQLERYKQIVENDEKYGKYKLYPIYYKTGFESSIDRISSAGYKFIGLEKILELLSPYETNIKNEIFLDYLGYWRDFQTTAMEYKCRLVDDWEWNHANGFYSDFKNLGVIQKEGFGADFGYVANPRGGLLAMWMGNQSFLEYNMQKYELYLQYEYTKSGLQLCLRIGIKKESGACSDVTPSELRNFLTYYEYCVKEEGMVFPYKKFGFDRPTRYGTGMSMNIAVMPMKNISYEEIINRTTNVLMNFNKIISFINARKVS